jgi:hypothetical protein
MRFEMQAFAADRVLAGALQGQKVFGRLVAAITPSNDPQLCYLDFVNVDVATTSFLRECIIGFRNHALTHWSNVYPIVANLSQYVREELEHFLLQQGDALVICKLTKAGEPSNVHVLGHLDEKQEITLRAVIDEGEVDAPSLARKDKSAVSPTAWNNRLAALAAKGLVIETSSGRGKKYRPVLQRLRYGT